MIVGDYWEDNGIEKPQSIIVCAACSFGTTIICGARHWDKVMRNQLGLMNCSVPASKFEQGFIDQFGDFHDRFAAFRIVQESGQPYNRDSNGSDTELFSEGMY